MVVLLISFITLYFLPIQNEMLQGESIVSYLLKRSFRAGFWYFCLRWKYSRTLVGNVLLHALFQGLF